MYQAKSTAIIYGMIHFLVDFCCAFFMFSISVSAENFYIEFLIYNFLAFAMQMPVGLLADRWKRNSPTALVGCFMVLGALLSLKAALKVPAVLWVGIFLAGLGNCLFHVGGGMEVMKRCPDKAAPLGIFVSPGAIGIFLGTMLGKQRKEMQVILLVLLVSALVCWKLAEKRLENDKKFTEEVWERDAQKEEGQRRKYLGICRIAGAVGCFFFVVVVRSYLGMIANFPWKDTMIDSMLAVLAVFLGKLAGGFLADKYGIKKVAVSTLFGAAGFFFFSGNVVCGVLALFLFNMSMPITLYLAAKVLGGQNGFAFGVLTFAIFIGFLPAYAGYSASNNIMLTGLTVVSCVFLGVGICLYEQLMLGRQNEKKGLYKIERKGRKETSE